MNLEKQLIRLGSTNPELRRHLRPILRSIKGGVRYWDEWEYVKGMLGPEDALVNVMGWIGDNETRDQFKYMARMWELPIEVTRRSRPGDLLDEFERHFRNMEKLADEFVQGLSSHLVEGAIKNIKRHYELD